MFRLHNGVISFFSFFSKFLRFFQEVNRLLSMDIPQLPHCCIIEFRIQRFLRYDSNYDLHRIFSNYIERKLFYRVKRNPLKVGRKFIKCILFCFKDIFI